VNAPGSGYPASGSFRTPECLPTFRSYRPVLPMSCKGSDKLAFRKTSIPDTRSNGFGTRKTARCGTKGYGSIGFKQRKQCSSLWPRRVLQNAWIRKQGSARPDWGRRSTSQQMRRNTPRRVRFRRPVDDNGNRRLDGRGQLCLKHM